MRALQAIFRGERTILAREIDPSDRETAIPLAHALFALGRDVKRCLDAPVRRDASGTPSTSRGSA